MIVSIRPNVIYEVFRRHFTPPKYHRNGCKVSWQQLLGTSGTTRKWRCFLDSLTTYLCYNYRTLLKNKRALYYTTEPTRCVYVTTGAFPLFLPSIKSQSLTKARFCAYAIWNAWSFLCKKQIMGKKETGKRTILRKKHYFCKKYGSLWTFLLNFSYLCSVAENLWQTYWGSV